MRASSTRATSRKPKKARYANTGLKYVSGIQISTMYPRRTPVPATMNCVLKYMDNVTIDAGTGTPGQYKYAANGLYDPNVTGAGHQPRGFDQLMGLYQRYTVMASSIKITVALNDVNENKGIGYLGVFPCNVLSPAFTDFPDYWEQPLYKWVSYSNNVPVGSQPMVRNYVNCAEQLGKKDLIDDDSVSGDYSQNPSDIVYWQIVNGNTSSTLNPAACSIIVELTFNVIFSRPTNITAS